MPSSEQMNPSPQPVQMASQFGEQEPVRAVPKGDERLDGLHQRAQRPDVHGAMKLLGQRGQKTQQVASILLGEPPRLELLGSVDRFCLCHERNYGILF